MALTASDIVDRSLTLIDEVPTTFATAATTETSIRDQALEILPELCRDLIKELPWELKRYLSKEGTLVNMPLSGGEDQSMYLKQKVVFTAPDDFWELVSIQLGVWSKPVVNYMLIGSEQYPKQNNPFTRAGKQNPVVMLNNSSNDDGSRIECFSVNRGDATTVSNFQYVAFDNVPNDLTGQDAITWPNEVFDEVSKALANELHIIKNRMSEAEVKGEEITNALEQHE